MERGTKRQPVGDSRLLKSPSILRNIVKEVNDNLTVHLIHGNFMADGEPNECAIWAYMMILMERDVESRKAKEAAEKEANSFAELMNRTFYELLNQEQEGEKEE